jgi:hypothetical protein
LELWYSVPRNYAHIHAHENKLTGYLHQRNVYSVFRFDPLSVGLAQPVRLVRPTRNLYQDLTSFDSMSAPTEPRKKTDIAPIAGGVAGGVTALIALGIVICVVRRRRRMGGSNLRPIFDDDTLVVDPSQQGSGNDFHLTSLYTGQQNTGLYAPSMSSVPNDPSFGRPHSHLQGVVDEKMMLTPPSTVGMQRDSDASSSSAAGPSQLTSSTSPPSSIPTHSKKGEPPVPQVHYPPMPAGVGGAQRSLTPQQLQLVDRLSAQGISPGALTAVIESLLNTGEVGPAGQSYMGHGAHEHDAPPAYE